MQRGSDQHGPRTDEDLKKDFEGTERANRPTRAYEWRDPEPDEPEPDEPEPDEPEPDEPEPDSSEAGAQAVAEPGAGGEPEERE